MCNWNQIALGWSNALFARSHSLSQEAIPNDERPAGDIYIPSTRVQMVWTMRNICIHSIYIYIPSTASDFVQTMWTSGKICIYIFCSSISIIYFPSPAVHLLQIIWTLGKICMPCHCLRSPIYQKFAQIMKHYHDLSYIIQF